MSQDAIPQKEYAFRITDIEHSNSSIDENIVGIFRFEPSSMTKKGPTLVVIADIEGVGYMYDRLIDVVNTEAEHARTLLTNIEQEPVTRFEKVIQNINKSVADFLREEAAPINWNRVNLFIIELSDGHMCLAGIGRLMNMFLQKQEDGSYKTFDLFASLDQRVDTDPEKVFSNIICGDFAPGDVLMAGSKNFERIRNEFRLRERLTTLPPVTAALEIKQDLERRGTPDDFVATVVTLREIDIPKPVTDMHTEPLKERSTASIEKLRQTEAETLRHLAPSIGRGEKRPMLGEPNAPRIGAMGIITRVGDMTKRLFHRGERIHDVASMTNLRGMHDGFGSWLTKRKKTFIIALACFAIGGIATTMIIKHQRNITAERNAWNESYDKIRAAIEKTEGESVYSEDRARTSMANALEQLDTLDTATDARKQAVEELKAQAAEIRKKLQRIVTTQSPTKLYALTDGISDGALRSPIVWKGNIVVADRAGNKITVINPTDKKTVDIAMPEGKPEITSLAPGKSSVIVAFSDKTLAAVNIETKEVSNLSLSSSANEITDAVTYTANRLYILDAGSQQIWRHQMASGGFGAGTKYLQANAADLSNAASIAIDSNVYVLKKNGSVVRFSNGGQDGFNLAAIDPVLENGNQIWTDPDATVIAIADANGKRVATFTKEGRLIAQFTSPAFKGPTDVIGDVANKKLYVVDGNAIYELILP